MPRGPYYTLAGVIVGVTTAIWIWIHSFSVLGTALGILVGWILALLGGLVAGFFWPAAILIVAVLALLFSV